MTCCKDCGDREVGCHCICEKYIEQKIQHDEEMVEIKRQRWLEEMTHNNERNRGGVR